MINKKMEIAKKGIELGYKSLTETKEGTIIILNKENVIEKYSSIDVLYDILFPVANDIIAQDSKTIILESLKNLVKFDNLCRKDNTIKDIHFLYFILKEIERINKSNIDSNILEQYKKDLKTVSTTNEKNSRFLSRQFYEFIHKWGKIYISTK